MGVRIAHAPAVQPAAADRQLQLRKGSVNATGCIRSLLHSVRLSRCHATPVHLHAAVFLPIPALAQTTRSVPQPPQARSSDLSTSSAQDWANRLMASDPKVRATAEAALVEGAAAFAAFAETIPRSSAMKTCNLKTFEIIRRIGPPAIPLLVDLLRHERVSIRRSAVDALIDLAPNTESIQPALRRALRDEDSDGRGRCRTRPGRVGQEGQPFGTRSRQDSLARGSIRPHLRGGGPGVHRSEGGRGDHGPGQSPGRSDSRRSMGGV